jgi:hypothetical protein
MFPDWRDRYRGKMPVPFLISTEGRRFWSRWLKIPDIAGRSARKLPFDPTLNGRADRNTARSVSPVPNSPPFSPENPAGNGAEQLEIARKRPETPPKTEPRENLPCD